MPDPKETEEKVKEADKPAAKEPAKPDQQFVPQERFDQVMETVQTLERKAAELETKVKSAPIQSSPGRAWDQVSEQDLEYVITHQAEYPDHVQGAFKELRKRDRESVKSELSAEIGTQTYKAQHPEAFDASSPLGKEVTKILGANRNQQDILADVIELAQMRIGTTDKESKTKKQIVDNLKNAGTHAPGSEQKTEPPAPSFMDMPKTEFENALQKVKMGAFNK